MKVISVLCILLMQGCGKVQEKQSLQVYEVAVPVQPYVNMFVQAAAINGRAIDIESLIVELTTENITDGELGHCVVGKIPRIRINSKHWPRLSPWHQRLLVFHELGHCILGLVHNDDHHSIMSTYSIGDRGYNGNSYFNLDEMLFKFGY